MRLHVPAARRSGVALMMAGFIAGIVLTMTAFSVMKDEHVLRQLGNDDGHLHHHHHHHQQQQQQQQQHGGSDGHRHHHGASDGHHHQHGVSEEGLKVVDLSEQDKHKHSGQRRLPLVWSCITSNANSQVLANVTRPPRL